MPAGRARAFGRVDGVFVDVIAQEEHGVDVFLGKVGHGGVVAAVVLLARGHGKAHARRKGTRGR